MLMLRFLLVWAIVSCGVEDSQENARYRIDVEGLVAGKHVYLGKKLAGVSIKVVKFVVRTEYGDGDIKRSVTDEGTVTSGSLQVDVSCSGKEGFSEQLTVTSETTKVPDIEFANDKFSHSSCKLEVVYDDGETEHPNRDKQTIDFNIVEEGYCGDNSQQPTKYIIGQGFKKRCAKQTFEPTEQCNDNLKVFYYTDGASLSSEPLNGSDHAVVVMTEVDDSWSIPNGCNLKINNRDYVLTKPSAGQNIAQSVEKTAIKSVDGKVSLEADNDGNLGFYLTVDRDNWYKQSTLDNFLAYPNDLRQLAIMTHKEGWWSYLSGPNVYGIDKGPLTAGQPIIFKDQPAPPPPRKLSNLPLPQQHTR